MLVAKQFADIEVKTTKAIMHIKAWLNKVSLELAKHKTKVVLVSSRKKIEICKVRIGVHIVQSAPALKYLRVIIDHGLNFRCHINYVAKKAAGIQAALARIMPNMGGLKTARRNTTATVLTSVIMYASPMWVADG